MAHPDRLRKDMRLHFLLLFMVVGLFAAVGCVSEAERAYQVEQNRHFGDADVRIEMEQQARAHFSDVHAVVRSAYDSGQKLVTPKLVKNVLPDFPKAKAKSRSQGGVWIAFTLDQSGNVSDLKPLVDERVPQDPEFVAAALNAVKQWKFSPATADGKPIPYLLSVPVIFQVGWSPNKALN